MTAIKITKENFKKEVLESKQPVLLDFWAPWCNPCRMLGPVIEEVASETAGSVTVGKVNVVEEPELASMFQVMGIPALLVLDHGKVVNSMVGLRSKQSILELIHA